ncbi:MAG TPA: DUF1476 domain-containing protein [Stellaceae bacterium]|jgi:hypothetical protein
MPTFAERERDFENRFRHDHEFQFKVTARRNRLLGLWAARHLGLLGEAADAYGKHVVDAQFGPGGDQNVIDKVATDLGARDPMMTDSRIRFELRHFAEQAKQQLMAE